MNSRVDIDREISKVIVALTSRVTAEEAADGWTEQSKAAAANYFHALRSSLAEGQELPPLGIVRGLDHWGVVGGELLEEVARITNKLRAQ